MTSRTTKSAFRDQGIIKKVLLNLGIDIIAHLLHTALGFLLCIMAFCAVSEKLIFLYCSSSYSKVITVIRHLGKRCGLWAPRCVNSAESAWNWPHAHMVV